ncbi:DUF55-domain-containing protein [Cystobasidium minutum MCA 4210]|uniref:DUF55-domain-containing protein n=1 Tax=Cystobasidium minutum MCA 4210 TaxID=1397322 RepID=UPI0034CFA262|eukprot:jgi/Rhomi1/191933/gm1.147_g
MENGNATAVKSQASAGPSTCNYWLMKAEPDTRMVKGVDVAFPIDKLESMKTSPWDGVRNSLAKRYMKEQMKLGDKILFYHSNTKMPGVAGLAEVCKESYPDHTAWDPTHPYYDASTKQDKPTWYMVDVMFISKMKNFVPLSLYKYLATQQHPPKELPYLTQEHLDAIKAMPLITRGRLSVQEASKLAYEATVLMGENGGFEGLVEVKTAKKPYKNKKRPSAANEEVNAAEDTTASATPAAAPVASSSRATRSNTAALQDQVDGGSLSKRSRRS